MSVIKGLTLAGAEGFDYSRFIAGVGSGIEQEGYNAGYVTPDVGLPSFALIFKDLGAGVVDVKPLVGAVAATFTRATTSTTVLPTGLIGSVASGSPRSYYDPTSLAYLGYLAEGARTNLCLQSEDFSTTWANNATTESVNATTAPDGAVTADKIAEDNTTAEHGMVQSITVVNATVYTFSVFAKQSERPRLALYESSTTGAQATFDLSTGTVIGTAGGGTPSAAITAFPNGWYRCTMTFTAGASAAQNFNTRILRAGDGSVTSYLGVTGNGIFQWGAQVEAASFASSYMPTTVASFTRNADQLTYPTSPWFNNATGTWFAVNQFLDGTSATNYRVMQTDDGSNNNFLGIIKGAGTAVVATTNSGGVQQANMTTNGALASNSTQKTAFAYAVNDFAAVTNAGTVQTDTSGVVAVGQSSLAVGFLGGGLNVQHLFGTISRIAYFPTKFPDYLLRQLTS